MPCRYFSALAALLFVTVCAYSAAALYDGAALSGRYTVQERTVCESAELRGIVIRSEQRLSLSRSLQAPAADGERLPAGSFTGGSSALYFEDCDGFEELSVENIDPLDSSMLRELLSRRPFHLSRGRLVTGREWYYWALCPEELSLTQGDKCRLRFDGFRQEAEAWVCALGENDNGENTVLFRLNRGESEYMKLRKTGAELILDRHQGLYLPDEYLQTHSPGNYYVCTLTGGERQSKPVDIIYRGDGFSLADTGGELRPGDRLLPPAAEEEGQRDHEHKRESGADTRQN